MEAVNVRNVEQNANFTLFQAVLHGWAGCMSCLRILRVTWHFLLCTSWFQVSMYIPCSVNIYWHMLHGQLTYTGTF